MVEKDLSHHAKRHLVRPALQLDEVDGEVLAEEVERDDVKEVQQDGYGVGQDIHEVDHLLQSFVIDDARGEAIEEDVQQVDGEDDGQVEPHAVEIQHGGLPETQLVEKLDVEQIEHPTADAERQQSGQHAVSQQHVR